MRFFLMNRCRILRVSCAIAVCLPAKNGILLLKQKEVLPMLQIKNGRVLTMAGKTFENGQVLIENGKIKSVGEYLSIPNAKAEVIDARGGWFCPA